jgi:membrane-associated phospholipid phosphatase
MLRARVVLTVALLAAVLAEPAVSRADEPIESGIRSPFRVHLDLDLALIAGVGGIWGAAVLIDDRVVDDACIGCAPRELGPSDQEVVHKYSLEAGAASDVFVYALMAAPFVLDLIDVAASDDPDALGTWSTDALVLLQTMLVSGMVNQLFKMGVQRPRPFTHNLGALESDYESTDATMSFYSGHTSMAFTAAVAYSYLFQARHPDSPWVLPVWITSLGLAGTVGVLRVEAGKHFWTDVAAGAIAGAAIGYLVPALHTRDPYEIGDVTFRLGASSSEYGAPMLTLGGTF